MAEDADLEARMKAVAHRVEFIELLDDEGPLPPRDLVEALPHSRATVTRALRELREAALVEKQDGDYGPTLAGSMAAEQYRRYERASEAVLSADSLLEPIPGGHAPPVEILVDADTILAEGDIPVRALEAVSNRVRRADSVEAYLPTLVNTHLLRVWHRAVLAESVESMAVFDPDLLTVLKGQYPHLLAEMAAADGFETYSTMGPPYGLVLTTIDGTTSVAVIVYEDDTKVRGVLTNDAPAAVSWVRNRLEGLRAESAAVTAELEALSEAVADGVRPLRRPTAGGRSDAPGGFSRGTSEGHALPIDLEAEGFVRLSERYFEDHGQAEPAVSWRTGFTLAEIQAGHAIDRQDPEGRNLTDRLVGAAKTATDHVVLGPPGSGKSTICMAVACAWYDRRLGPVLYREHGAGDRFESVALLEAYLRQTGGHALVVVEDAIRDDANRIFEVMQSLDAEPSVTFLLDSRTHEWRTAEVVDLDARLDAYRRTTIEAIDVPRLDETECIRFVEHFAALVGSEPDISGTDLFELLQTGTAAPPDEEGVQTGDALLAQHHLARWSDSSETTEAPTTSALEEAVHQTYQTLADAEPRLGTDLGVMVALLTAAGIPVAVEYLYALADPDEFDAIEEAISLLHGRLLFEPNRPRATSAAYRTRHETWAMEFLEAFREIEPIDRARERFGRCATRLFALADDADRRQRIQRHLGGQTPYIHQIEADSRGWADELTERLFGLGRTDASIAPLFGETADSTIELPRACSSWTRLQQPYWRGEMNRILGDLDRAEREYRTLQQMAENFEFPTAESVPPATPVFVSASAVERDDEEAHRTRWRATSLTNLGVIASERGEIDPAQARIEEALALYRDIDDREGEATCLKHLGQVAFYASDYERARELFENGLTIARDLEARLIEFGCLMDLGAVTVRQSDYDRGLEYLEQSLSIARDVGMRREEAQVLNNLGVVATYQGAYGKARRAWTASLAIRRELGDRQGEADSLDNLGMGARKRGNLDRARDLHEEALAIRRDIGYRSGEATSLVNLGALAREQGALDRAEKRFESALDIFETIGGEKGIAEIYLEQGLLSLDRGAIDDARESAEEALETFEELALHIWTARSRHLLGRIAAAAGSPEAARDHWRTALETFESVGAPPDALETLTELVGICREQGDEESAREWCQRAGAVVSDAPDSIAEQYRDWVEQQADDLNVT